MTESTAVRENMRRPIRSGWLGLRNHYTQTNSNTKNSIHKYEKSTNYLVRNYSCYSGRMHFNVGGRQFKNKGVCQIAYAGWGGFLVRK